MEGKGGDADGRPRVLVAGGCGQIGRNFVKFLVDNDLCSYIAVADKTMPVIAYFGAAHKEAFASPIVKYVQADLSKERFIAKVFDGQEYDFIFNLAAETKYGQAEDLYEKNIVAVSTNLGEAAQRQSGLRMFVEVSTAHVYKSQSKKPAKEDYKTDPWTKQGEFSLRAEDALRAMDQSALPLTIVRPALVYGTADTTAIMPRAVVAASYKQLGKKMKFLWDTKTRINTVHMADVCRALWHVATDGAAAKPAGEAAVYNLADKGDTNQGSVNAILKELFGIKTGFYGKLLSSLAKLNLEQVVEQANDDHLQPWMELTAVR